METCSEQGQNSIVDESDSQPYISSCAHNGGRLYIPHGAGKELIYKPHTKHMDVSYTQCGPDWSSSIRWLPSPKPKKGQSTDTIFHPPMKSLRHFPRHNASSAEEYKFYPPHGIPLVYANGKVTTFEQVHKASQLSFKEIRQADLFGQHRKVLDPRNGISEAAPGDKPYQAVEYSRNFHKQGSTRPIVDFGGRPPRENITQLSPQATLQTATKPYSVKEQERKKVVEINSVQKLETWRPSSPLQIPTLDTRA